MGAHPEQLVLAGAEVYHSGSGIAEVGAGANTDGCRPAPRGCARGERRNWPLAVRTDAPAPLEIAVGERSRGVCALRADAGFVVAPESSASRRSRGDVRQSGDIRAA